MKHIFKFLPILAIISAFIYFKNIDSTSSSFSYNFPMLLISGLLLFIVFIFRSFLWKSILNKFNVRVNFIEATESLFSTILYKYIPGKIWGLLGKADNISQKGHPLTECSVISLFLQVITIITGLFIGSLGLLIFNIINLPDFFIYLFITLFILLLLFFNKGKKVPYIHSKIIPAKLKSLYGKEIPPMSDLLVLSVLHWLLLGTAYSFFIFSIGFSFSFLPVFLQPLANNIGIISSFTPSGLGVREAVMAAYLILQDLSIVDATAISIIARIWFFLIELFCFFCGIVLKYNLPN